MEKKQHFLSIKTKIMLSTIIPVILSFSLICTIIFASFFNALHNAAEAELSQISQKYAVGFESKINNAMNYLSIVAATLEIQVETGNVDREQLQKTIFNIFEHYELIDGSSIYFERDMYDGRDTEYIGSQYGTPLSGKICYYFYKDGGQTAYLREALGNDIEFMLPHYTEAKKSNKVIYTEPTVYEVDGRTIPMFTITYPIRDSNNTFIGAVTVDLFLEDIYAQIQNEEIYETGYVIIANDKNQVIYSPHFEDIGKTRLSAGIYYALPAGDDTTISFKSKSIINGKSTLVSLETVYIPQLDSRFYVSVAAPTGEINAGGIRMITDLAVFCLFIVIIIALLLQYLIGRISTPIKEITESANKIANGEMDEASAFVQTEYNTGIIDEVYILSIAIRKMLSQINQIQGLKLEALEMKHKKDKAEAAAQAKNDFLANMSHEIRTPMNAVMGMTELILRKDLPQDIYENALMIKSSSNNLLSIINDILDFSKIESGKLEILEAVYSLPSLVNDVVSVIRIRLVDKPVLFAVNIDPTVPASLIGDEIRIRQILTNLLNNAVKYTNEGAVSLAISGEVSGDSVTLTMEVSDSGVGIKEEDVGKLFGNFVQIDTAKNKGIEGTGLGLAIARNLCRLMGGDISVRSEYGKGSVFTVTLPQKFELYTPFASVTEPEKKSVLLYETRKIYRESIIGALESLGVRYKSAENIPELFENLERYSFVLVSSFAYGSISPTLSKLAKPPKLALLSDITEASAPKGARIVTLPTHTLSIANILNDIEESFGGINIINVSFIAPDAKVLIVDDVMANLKVAEGLLLPYEVQVTLCSGGREAIELVAENRYDLVFMDHMMPEMDGLEATRLIRELNGEFFKSLPIIALTANAVSGVKEMFIQNGMNDFLAKPIETAKLDSILGKWIPDSKRKKVKVTEKHEETSDFVDMLEAVPELSVPKALSVVGGSAKTFERIVKLSGRLLPENIARLNGLIENDLPNYSIEVHGMKSVLNNIGAYELGLKAFELEELSRNGDSESCMALHPGFIDKLTALSDSLNALLAKAEQPDKTEGSKSLLLEVLHKLREAAEFFDSALALKIVSALDEYTYGSDTDEKIRELVHAFECFDFDKAEDLLNKLEGAIVENV